MSSQTNVRQASNDINVINSDSKERKSARTVI